MDKVEQARKLFLQLEKRGTGEGQANEVARRAFEIRERLAEFQTH